MKNKIRNAKQFIQNHDHKIAAALGLVVGAGGTYVMMRTPHTNAILHITRDQIEQLMSNPDSVVEYELPRATCLLAINN